MKISIKKTLTTAIVLLFTAQAYSARHVEKNQPVSKETLEAAKETAKRAEQNSPEIAGFESDLAKLDNRIELLKANRDKQIKWSDRYNFLNRSIADMESIRYNLDKDLTQLKETPVKKQEPMKQKVVADLERLKLVIDRTMAE